MLKSFSHKYKSLKKISNSLIALPLNCEYYISNDNLNCYNGKFLCLNINVTSQERQISNSFLAVLIAARIKVLCEKKKDLFPLSVNYRRSVKIVG